MLLTLPRFVLLVLARSVAAQGLSLWQDADRGAPDGLNLLQLQSEPAQNTSGQLAPDLAAAPAQNTSAELAPVLAAEAAGELAAALAAEAAQNASSQLAPVQAAEPAQNTSVQQAPTLAHVLREGDDCNLCRGGQDWLFILGTGRSGSTTALEMVDAIPGVYLAGENMGVMNTFMKLYDEHRDLLALRDGAENRMLCGIQRFIRTLIGEFDERTTKVIGFKEIRILSRKQLAFMKKVFPAGKFVLNTRKNLERQHMSQFQMDIPMMELRNWTRELELFQGDHPDDTFLLRLEEYNSDTYNRLLDFIGVSGCYFAFIAHANNGWHWNDDGPHATRALQGHCGIDNWDKARCIKQVEQQDLMPKLGQMVSELQ